MTSCARVFENAIVPEAIIARSVSIMPRFVAGPVGEQVHPKAQRLCRRVRREELRRAGAHALELIVVATALDTVLTHLASGALRVALHELDGLDAAPAVPDAEANPHVLGHV